MKYQMMVPPFEVPNFRLLKKKQADQIFNWYVGEIPFRLKLLQEYLDLKTDSKIKLTGEPETLRMLWSWFLGTITTRKRTKEELENDLKDVPEYLHRQIEQDDKKIEWESLSIGMDIAIYFAEIVICHHPNIHWGYFTKPKNRMSVNEPVLLGFLGQDDLNPRLIVNNCMLHSLRDKDPNKLWDCYNFWISEKIEDKILGDGSLLQNL